jgi:uncharacterized protein
MAGPTAKSSAGTPAVIQAYGAGGFRIDGEAYRGSILILPDRVEAWPVSDMAAVTAQSLAPVLAVTRDVDVLLLGCGARMALVPPALRQELRAAGIVIDAMDTGAACRTFNVLRAEERRVAAALIAIGESR